MRILGHVEYVIRRTNLREFRKSLRQILGGGYTVGGVRVTPEKSNDIKNTEYVEVTVKTSCQQFGVTVRILASDVYLHAFKQLGDLEQIWHKFDVWCIDEMMPGGNKLPFNESYITIGKFTGFTFNRYTLESAIMSLSNVHNVAQPNLWKRPLFCLAIFLCEASRLPEIDHALYDVVENNDTVTPDVFQTWEPKIRSWGTQCMLYVKEVEAVEGKDFLKLVDPIELHIEAFRREESEDDAGSGSSGRTVGDITEYLELTDSLGLIVRSVVDDVIKESEEKKKNKQKQNRQKKRQ